jgi:uncharacterized membrane protein
MPWLKWYIASMVFYTIAEYYSKVYANAQSWMLLIFISVCYGINGAFWLPALKENNSLTIMSTIWAISYCLFSIFIGLALFGEHISVIQMVGVGLGILAVFLMCL